MLITPRDIQLVSNEIMNMLHEDEVEIVNDFYEAVVAKEIDKIDELFKVVMYDVEEHFTTEEQMMEQSQFYAMQIHKNEHDTMREKLKKSYERWQSLKSPLEVKQFFEEEFKPWIKLHISRWDSETAMHIGDTN